MITIRGWHIAVIVGVIGLLSLFYKGLWGNPQYIPPVLIGKPAPEFSGPDLYTGETLSLTQFQGKVVMVNFWASWCLECRDEHPNLLAIQKQFGDHPDFVMLGINYQDEEENAKKYLEVYGNAFRHVRDPDGKISIDYGVYGVPETFVFDRQGIIRYKHIGPIIGPTYPQLTNQVILPLLQGQPPQAS
jgi:cytochrome c biogenesis protein CcmG/thiol:disulfide interchange protein DsbE